MGALGDNRVKLLLAGFVLSVVLLVGIGVAGLLAGLTAIFSPAYAGTPLFFALLDATAPYVVAAVLDGLLSVVLFVALAVSVARNAELPRSDRLGQYAALVERVSPQAREFGLAERVSPTTEDRIDDLKARYVDGELTELEYERRLQELLDEESVREERVRRERERLR